MGSQVDAYQKHQRILFLRSVHISKSMFYSIALRRYFHFQAGNASFLSILSDEGRPTRKVRLPSEGPRDGHSALWEAPSEGGRHTAFTLMLNKYVALHNNKNRETKKLFFDCISPTPPLTSHGRMFLELLPGTSGPQPCLHQNL